MRRLRNGQDVWLWWGNGWAAQFHPGAHVSFGFHLDVSRRLASDRPENRPLLDLHLGWLTVALGPDSHITGQDVRQTHSCRGFVFTDHPLL